MIAWLTSRAGAIALAALLVIVSAAALRDGIVQRATIRTLEADKTALQKRLDAANTNLGTCQANYRVIELAVDRQGADIRGLSAATDAAGKRAEQAAKDGKAAREAAVQASRRVLALPPPAPENACAEAARLLRGPL